MFVQEFLMARLHVSAKIEFQKVMLEDWLSMKTEPLKNFWLYSIYPFPRDHNTQYYAIT